MTQLHVSTASGSTWQLKKGPTARHLRPATAMPAAEVVLDPATAWQFFTRDLAPNEARCLVEVVSDKRLTMPVLQLVAVMA